MNKVTERINKENYKKFGEPCKKCDLFKSYCRCDEYAQWEKDFKAGKLDIESFKPTNDLRFLRIPMYVQPQLQQKWVSNIGNTEWREIKVVEEYKKQKENDEIKL